jgi:hypothetical protein
VKTTVLRRLALLEMKHQQIRPRKTVIRFAGPGSEEFDQPAERDIDEDIDIVTICFWSPEFNENTCR